MSDEFAKPKGFPLFPVAKMGPPDLTLQVGVRVEEKLVPQKKNILEDYEITGRVLGKGLTGDVIEMRHKTNGNLVALKVLPDTQKGRQEVDLHYKCNFNPNVLKIKAVYEQLWQEKPSILVVTELLAGGELFDRIQNQGGFSERDARRFFRQMLIAVKHLHDIGIAHRDLKPENFLCVDDSALTTIKLIDFGFAKAIVDVLATPVYTPYYVAPEILHVRSHTIATYDKACDLWSLGVILYIMLSGTPPFYSNAPSSRLDAGMVRSIKQGNFEFDDPKWDLVTDIAKDVVRGLLRPIPEERLTIAQILDHDWLKQDEVRVPSTPLGTAGALSASPQLWNDALSGFQAALEEMRTGSKAFVPKAIDLSNSELMHKRHKKSEESS